MSRKGSDVSSGFYSAESASATPLVDTKRRSLLHLERQDSIEEEFEDTVEWLDARDASPKSSTSSGTPPVKRKKEKKKHFHMFHRSNKKKQKHHTISEALGSVHDSVQTLPPPPSISESSLRSAISRSSIGSEGSEGSLEPDSDDDQGFVESLINPSGNPHRKLSVPHARRDSETRPETPEERIHYLIHIVLQSGHNLAVRDRTGTSDPYVKFKCGLFRYRSSVVYRNLNPHWKEQFEFQTVDLKEPLRVKVYDHDRGSLDDYMGGASVDLTPYTDGELHIIELGLDDPHAKEESLGYIRIFLQVTPRSRSPSPERLAKNQRKRSTQLWKSVLTVTLLEGKALPAMDDNGLSDPYCKFKLGTQKHKSKICPKTLNPQWKQRFELRVYNEESSTLHIEVWDRDFIHSDDFMGDCSVDLNDLQPEMTHDLTLPLEGVEGEGSIHMLLCLSGTSVVEESAGKRNTREIDMKRMAWSYGVHRSLDVGAIKRKDVGFLRVRVEKAEHMPSTCNTFAIVEVGNSAVRTHTVYKSSNPTWDKTFHFNVKDVHNELEVSLYDDVCHKSGKTHFIGKIRVPLLRLENGVCKPYALKEKHCLHGVRGVVFLECELIYNPFRAAIRTVHPIENKLLEEEQKFQRKVLMGNIKRVTTMAPPIVATVDFMKSLCSWENKLHSGAAFIIFVVVCLFGELWMFLLLGALGFVYSYLVVHFRGKHRWQIRDRQMTSSESTEYNTDNSDLSDLEEVLASEPKESSKNLREKFRQIQEVLVIVQTILGFVADLGERVVNLFNWRVPFLCWLAISVLLTGAFVLYFVPIRYIVLLWGINKFTKKLRNPNYIEHQELLDYLTRAPTNKQLMEWRELHVKRNYDAKKRKKKPN